MHQIEGSLRGLEKIGRMMGDRSTTVMDLKIDMQVLAE